MSLNNRPRSLVDKAEEDQVSRNVLNWLNTCPEIPRSIRSIKYEMLEDDTASMALSTIPGTYILTTDITGDYEAEYQFKVIYRGQPESSGDRLRLDETLDSIGDWAVLNGRKHGPSLGAGKRPVKVETSTRSSLFARYENGDEDHQIIMKLTYSVSV